MCSKYPQTSCSCCWYFKAVHSHVPMTPPLVEWRHDWVGSADLEFQSGYCHFGSSPRHLLGRIQSEPPTASTIVVCMQEGDKEEEELPLYYQVPLQRLLSWNRWWHIVARLILVAYQKRYWGLLGNYLQEVVGIPGNHFATNRQSWGRGRGRLLRQLSKPAPKWLLEEHLCIDHYGRRELTPDIRKTSQSKGTTVHSATFAEVRACQWYWEWTPRGFCRRKRSEEAEIRADYTSVNTQPEPVRLWCSDGDHKSGNQGSWIVWEGFRLSWIPWYHWWTNQKGRRWRLWVSA